MEMIQATIRTNYYQVDDNGNPKPWLALKLMPRKIPEIPAPVPEFEIFVYAPDVEGYIYAQVKSHVVVYVGQTVKKISALKY